MLYLPEDIQSVGVSGKGVRVLGLCSLIFIYFFYVQVENLLLLFNVNDRSLLSLFEDF